MRPPGLPPVYGPARLPPLDEAPRDPALVAYRARLQAAVAARDWAALEGELYWRVAFGPDYEDAKRHNLAHFWGLPDPASPFWWKLGRALALGGRFRPGGMFVAPGLDLAWPAGYDPPRWLVAAGPEVALRAAPDPRAEVVAVLAFDLVELVTLPDRPDAPFTPEAWAWHTAAASHARPGYSAAGWPHVRTTEGQTGFLDPLDALSPLEHQAYFTRLEGRWWSLVAFVAPGAERPPG